MTELQDEVLHDADLLEEIGLTSELMVVASESDGPLSQAEVDRLLGVRADDSPPGHPAGAQGTERIRVTSTDPRTQTAAETL